MAPLEVQAVSQLTPDECTKPVAGSYGSVRNRAFLFRLEDEDLARDASYTNPHARQGGADGHGAEDVRPHVFTLRFTRLARSWATGG